MINKTFIISLNLVLSEVYNNLNKILNTPVHKAHSNINQIVLVPIMLSPLYYANILTDVLLNFILL